MRALLTVLRRWLPALRTPSPEHLANTIERDPDYCAAVSWAQHFQPDPEKSHGWAYDYAADQYRQLDATADYLDSKADALMRLIATGAAVLVSAILLVGPPHRDWLLVVFLLPSVFSALFAATLAAKLRVPQPIVIPPAANAALDYADAYPTEEDAKARFAAQLHAAAVGMEITVTHKATTLADATRWFVLAVWLLLLPLAVPLIHHLSDP